MSDHLKYEFLCVFPAAFRHVESVTGMRCATGVAAALVVLSMGKPFSGFGAEMPLTPPRMLRIVKEGNRDPSGREGRSRVPVPRFSPDGRILAVLDRGRVEVWDVPTWKLLRVLPREDPENDEFLTTVAFSADGKKFATGGRNKVVKIWESGTVAPLQTLTLAQKRYSQISDVAFSPDGETLASSSADKVVEIWHIASATLLHSLVGHSSAAEDLAFAGDGKSLVSAEDNGVIKWWDTSNGKLLRTLESRPEWVGIIKFSADGKFMATGRDFGVKLWDTQTGTLLHSIESKAYRCFYFSPDGVTLMTCANAATVQFWNMNTGVLKREVNVPPCESDLSLSLSSDGKMLAGGDGSGMLTVWQLDESE